MKDILAQVSGEEKHEIEVGISYVYLLGRLFLMTSNTNPQSMDREDEKLQKGANEGQ